MYKYKLETCGEYKSDEAPSFRSFHSTTSSLPEFLFQIPSPADRLAPARRRSHTYELLGFLHLSFRCRKRCVTLVVTWQRRRFAAVEVLFWHSCYVCVVMSEAAKDLVGSSKRQKLGPDYFGYYTHEVVELLSRNEDVSPFSSESSDISRSRYVEVRGIRGKDRIEHSNGVYGSLFSNSLGNELSDFRKERLKLLLRQGVKVLAPEVDEMIEPVVAMSQLKSQLESRKCLSRGAASDVDAGKAPSPKKLKRSSCSSSSLSALSSPTNSESNREVDDDWQFLIENNSLQVEETVKKYCDQYYAKLGHMEQQLEKILDTVMSKCRPMTIHEKHKLGKQIQKLPPENLGRVMEIIQNSNAAYTNSSDEVSVDLEKESNVTLWRLFHYVEAVENARKLASS